MPSVQSGTHAITCISRDLDRHGNRSWANSIEQPAFTFEPNATEQMSKGILERAVFSDQLYAVPPSLNAVAISGFTLTSTFQNNENAIKQPSSNAKDWW